MDKQETRDVIAIMQAWVNGRIIQYKHKTANSEWHDITGNPVWNWASTEYRVKPQDVYRPYSSPEECFNDLRCDGWLKRRESRIYMRIERLDMYVDYQKLFSEYTYVDGTPFGLKIS